MPFLPPNQRRHSIGGTYLMELGLARCVIVLNCVCVCVCRQLSIGELQQEVDRLASCVDHAASERQRLEALCSGTENQLDSLTIEHRRLTADHAELRRQRDVIADEKQQLTEDMEQLRADYRRWYVYCRSATRLQSNLC